MSSAQRDVPVDALLWHVDRRELDSSFPSISLLLTSIKGFACYTHRTRGGDDSEQWVGILDEVIKSQVQTVAQSGDIGTKVVVDCLLPSQIVVAKAIDDNTSTEDVRHQAVEDVGGVSLVCREVLITRVTHRGTKLQQLEDVAIFKPFLVMDIPTQAHRPCGTETVVGTKHRGSVVTKVEVEQIAIVVSISTIEIEARRMLDVLRISWLASCRIVVGKRRCCKLVVGEAGSRIAIGLACGIVEVETQYRIELMLLCDELTKCCRDVALVVEVFLQAMLKQSLLCGFLIIKVGMLRRQTLVLCIVVFGHTKLSTYTQIVGSKPFCYEIISKAEALTLIIVVEVSIP